MEPSEKSQLDRGKNLSSMPERGTEEDESMA